MPVDKSLKKMAKSNVKIICGEKGVCVGEWVRGEGADIQDWAQLGILARVSKIVLLLRLATVQ